MTKETMKFQMICPEGHAWIETYPTEHTLFGRCPVCRTTENTGKVIDVIYND